MYRHVGLVPEREAVHPYLTGLGFARLNARLQGVADPDAAAARAIATVDLADAGNRPIGTYSKGMRQRAKLAGSSSTSRGSCSSTSRSTASTRASDCT
jgi:ABC-2 type transport system ATP-binding protein